MKTLLCLLCFAVAANAAVVPREALQRKVFPTGISAAPAITSPINVQWFGAVGDGTTDDAAAIQKALDVAANSSVFFPNGTYNVGTALTYNAASGPIYIYGKGAIIRAVGVSNKCLVISGIAGVTSNEVRVAGIEFTSNTSGVSAAGLHLDGIAHFTVKDCVFSGGVKMTYGLRCTGSQQGEVSGCAFGVINGSLYESSGGGIHANGIDTHGNTYYCSSVNAIYSDVDSGSFHANHLTSAPVSIDVIGVGGTGIPVFSSNHIEQHTTAGIRSVGTVFIHNNSFFGGVAAVDILITGGENHVISSNLLSKSLTFSAPADRIRLIGNILTNTGTITNTSTNIQSFGNTVIAAAGTFGDTGNVLYDKMALTSRASAAGNILTLNPNVAVGGAWGMRIAGSGALQDIYVQFGDVTLNGNTSGASLTLKSGVNGTAWFQWVAAGTQFFNGATAGPMQRWGTGSPEAVVTAPVGSIFQRTDGGAGTSFYVKESGVGNTGWVAK